MLECAWCPVDYFEMGCDWITTLAHLFSSTFIFSPPTWPIGTVLPLSSQNTVRLLYMRRSYLARLTSILQMHMSRSYTSCLVYTCEHIMFSLTLATCLICAPYCQWTSWEIIVSLDFDYAILIRKRQFRSSFLVCLYYDKWGNWTAYWGVDTVSFTLAPGGFLWSPLFLRWWDKTTITWIVRHGP
jgi:hypothetical protein